VVYSGGGKSLSCWDLEFKRPQLSWIEQRISNPKQRLHPFSKNRVFNAKNEDFVISSEDQAKVKITCLRRAGNMAGKINQLY